MHEDRLHPLLRWTTYAGQRPLRFGAAAVAAIMILKLLFLAVLSLFAPIEDDALSGGVILQQGVFRVIAGFAFLPAETYLGQQLPIALLRRFGVSRAVTLVGVSAGVFGALHLFAGAAGFVTGASAGLVLSYAFLCWKPVSPEAAFWRTTAVHAAHNWLAYCAALLVPMGAPR